MRKMSKGVAAVLPVALVLAVCAAVYVLYALEIIPHKKYTNADFNIDDYISKADKDGDGIDDQTDMLNSVRQYIKTRPRYESRYYASGYPNDGYGVCTDVVGFGLKGAGYDLMELVAADIEENADRYNIEKPDPNIDFRRVVNLKVYFDNNAISLTTDCHDIDKWQGGDIVIFKKHIGVVSDKRNRRGVAYVIHHSHPMQQNYEEDILEQRNDIVGHYRIS